VGKRAQVFPARDFNLGAVMAGAAGSQAPVLLLHEIAYPFAGAPLMNKLALAALDHGGAVCTGPGDVAMGEINDGLVLPPVGSMHLQPIAMPQAFLREALQSLHAEEGGAIPAQQVWQRLQRRGEMVQSIRNPPFNIRIATSLDWLAARKVVWPWLLAKNKPAGGGT
jgi:2-C-methyl-D-erythritol 4-phosphate cytidylyltransferase